MRGVGRIQGEEKAGICEWDVGVSLQAATLGHLEILKWLRSRDDKSEICPWNDDVCEIAVSKNYTYIIEWLSGIDCPCGKKYHT